MQIPRVNKPTKHGVNKQTNQANYDIHFGTEDQGEWGTQISSKHGIQIRIQRIVADWARVCVCVCVWKGSGIGVLPLKVSRYLFKFRMQHESRILRSRQGDQLES